MINKKKIDSARKLLIDSALDDICSVENFTDFYLHVYYVIAKLGLQKEAKEEELFEGEEWFNPYYKEYLIKKLKAFLVKYIR